MGVITTLIDIFFYIKISFQLLQKNISSKLRTPLSSIKKAVVNQILLHTTFTVRPSGGRIKKAQRWAIYS